MTVQLSSLVVSADLDVGGYTSAAKAKVAADAAMASSGKAAGAVLSQTDQKISQAGGGLERLKRLTVEGYAASQQFEQGLRTLQRGIDAGKVSLTDQEFILAGLQKRYGITVTAAELMERGQVELANVVARTTTALAAQETQAAQTSAAAMKASNDNMRAGGGVNFRQQNLGFQLQDIGVSLYGGMPLTNVLLQQGSQIAGIYGGAGGVNALMKDLGATILTATKYLGPFAAAAALGYGAFRLMASYSAEAALAIDDTTAALAKQAAPFASVRSMVSDLYSVQKSYTDAISLTAAKQTDATNSIIANSEREFAAKKSLLELELKRQQAALATQRAEIGIAGLGLKKEVGQQVFTRMDLERQGYADPRVGSVPFVRVPDDISGLDKTRSVMENSGLNDKLKELRANLELNEIAAKELEKALGSTFDSTTVKASKANNAAANAFRDVIKNGKDQIDQMRLELSLIGRTSTEIDALTFKQTLLANATDKGRTVSAAQRLQIEKLADEYRRLAEMITAAKMSQDLMFERQQMFRSPIEQRVASELRGAGLDPSSEQGKLIAGQIRLNEQLALGRDLTMDFASGFVDDLKNGVSVLDALGNALSRLADQLIQMALNQAINGLFSNLLGAAGGSSFGTAGGFADMLGMNDPWSGMRMAKGGAFQGGNVIPFARGGVVSRPTLFPFARGIGLMGEAGAEAIMPLARDSQGRLGVRAGAANQNGASGLNLTYAPSYNVTGTTEDIDRLRQQMAKDRAEFESRTVAAVRSAQNKRAL